MVYNKYIRSFVAVPCRECDACVSQANLNKVERLEATRLLYFDCIFFTLTYSEEYVPRAIVMKDYFFHLSDNIFGKKYPRYGKTIDFRDDLDSLITRVGEGFDYIRVVSRSDITEFVSAIKRFSSDSVVFISTEYGPSTFRPHAHGLWFFNLRANGERELSIDQAGLFLSENWSTSLRLKRSLGQCHTTKSVPLGFVQYRYDDAVSARYTAQYTNCLTYLPRVLRTVFPPFSVYSRNLSEVYKPNQQQLFDLLYSSIVVSRPKLSYNEFGQKYYDGISILPLRFIYRYFPKFAGCDYLSLSVFALLLRYACNCPKESVFKSIVLDTYYSYALYRVFRCPLSDITDSQLYTLYYALNRCMVVCNNYFHGDVSWYFDTFISVHSKVKLYKLREFYEYQINLLHDGFPLEKIFGLYIFANSESALSYDLSANDLDFRNNSEYRRYAQHCKHMLLENTKTKKRNSYQGLI